MRPPLVHVQGPHALPGHFTKFSASLPTSRLFPSPSLPLCPFASIYAPFLLGSLKAVSWVKSMLFNEKPFKLAKSTLGDIAKVRGNRQEYSSSDQGACAARCITIVPCHGWVLCTQNVCSKALLVMAVML